MHLAFNYVAIAVMIAEINYSAEKLNLPMRLPILRDQLTSEMVASLDVMPFGGRLDTERFSFSFIDTGRLRYIIKLRPFKGSSMREKNEELSIGNSLITTNDAYAMATNWLSCISVDVHGLEKANPVNVKQRFYFDSPNSKKSLPVFDVKWGAWESPKIDICIDGRTKELVYLRLENDSFSQRPANLIKDRDKLLGISDEEFQKYSAGERADLISRFSAVSYPKSTLPAKKSQRKQAGAPQ